MDNTKAEISQEEALSFYIGRLFDKELKPIGYKKWAELRADQAYKVVARDVVGGTTVISAWFGIDQSSSEIVGGEAMYFGTILHFPGKGEESWGSEWFTPNLDACNELHKEIVKALTSGVKPADLNVRSGKVIGCRVTPSTVVDYD